MSTADQVDRVPVPDITRMRVWSELHDAVRYSRYFNRKASDMARRYRYVLIAHAVLAAGVLTILIDEIPHSFVAVTAGLGIAVLSVWLLLSNYAEKLAAVRRICEYADHIEHQYRDLWADIEGYAIDVEKTGLRLVEIERDYVKADDLFRRVGFVIDDDLNTRSANEARYLLQHEFASTTFNQESSAAASETARS